MCVTQIPTPASPHTKAELAVHAGVFSPRVEIVCLQSPSLDILKNIMLTVSWHWRVLKYLILK